MTKKIKKLYIFDFDETLVNAKGSIYVKNKNNNKVKSLTHHEYYKYSLNEDEYYDISDFDTVVVEKINKPIMDLLIKHKNKAVILTARDKPEPIKNFLLKLGIDVPINAIGINNPKSNSVFVNAERKKSWIKLAITTKNYNYIEFWDDNELNIEKAETLKEEFPDITLITHLVKM